VDADRKVARAAFLAGVTVLTLFALALRILGIRMGLPYHHHWDEVWVTDSAAAMLRHGDDVPTSYQYGAPLARLTEAAFVVLQWGRGPRGSGVVVTPADAQVTLYLLARLVTATISASGTVAVVVAAGAAARSRDATRAGLAAGCLYAVAPELVMHSRYGVTDACLVGLTAWTLAFAGLYLTRSGTGAAGTAGTTNRGLGWAAASVLAAGVTFAFKVPGIVTSIIPVAALAYGNRPSAPRSTGGRVLLVAALPTIALCYVFFNPHVVDRTSDALRDIVGRYRQTRDGGFSSVYLREPGLDHLASALWAIFAMFLHRTPVVALLLGGVSVGGIATDLRRSPVVGVALLHAVLLILSVALPNRTFLIRNYLVVLPCLCVGFGLGAATLSQRLERTLGPHGAWGKAAGVALGALAFAVVVGVPVHDALAAQRYDEDPRVLAVDFVEQQVQARGLPASVAVTPSVFGKLVLGGHSELRAMLERPGLQFDPVELDVCPPAVGGPDFVVAASYRDIKKADRRDPWTEQWLFEQCPGYDQVASFGPNPYEHNVAATPTWYGRVSARVFARRQ
jgi:hypothetical protein